MDKKKYSINEYLRTGIITFVVIVLLVVGLMSVKWLMMPQTLKQPKLAKTEEMDYYLIDFLIEKNQYLLMKYPKNYAYNIRLGTLYSIKKDYIAAEEEFKIAIEKSPYLAYRARYKLATLYIKLGRLPEAQKLMDDITDKANKKLIKHKGEVYKAIGAKLYEEGYYALAVTKYEKAIFYFKRVDKKQLKDAQVLLSKAYIAVADMYVEQGNVEDAIDSLKKADVISDEPEINYKLALLYIDTNPALAAKYLEDVLKNAPEMLDYYLYYDLLLKISESEEELGNKAAKDLYVFKAKKFKKYVYEEILYENDILMDILDVKTEYDKKNKTVFIDMKIRLRNNSPFEVKNLSTEIIFKEKDKIVNKYIKQLFAYENIFPMGEQTSVIRLETDIDTRHLDKHNDTINAEVYLYKKENHKKLIKIIPIKKQMELVETEE